MNTKAEITQLGRAIAQLDVPCRVVMFNELIPWLRKTCPRYSVIDFYEVVLGDVDWTRSGGTVSWNNLEARAVTTAVPPQSS